MLLNIIQTGLVDDQPASNAAISNVKSYIKGVNKYQLAYNSRNTSVDILDLRKRLTRIAECMQSYLELHKVCFPAPLSLHIPESILVKYLRIASIEERKLNDKEFEEISALISESRERWIQELQAQGEI